MKDVVEAVRQGRNLLEADQRGELDKRFMGLVADITGMNEEARAGRARVEAEASIMAEIQGGYDEIGSWAKGKLMFPKEARAAGDDLAGEMERVYEGLTIEHEGKPRLVDGRWIQAKSKRVTIKANKFFVKGGMSPAALFEQAVEAGFEFENTGDMLSAVYDSVAHGIKKYNMSSVDVGLSYSLGAADEVEGRRVAAAWHAVENMEPVVSDHAEVYSMERSKAVTYAREKYRELQRKTATDGFVVEVDGKRKIGVTRKGFMEVKNHIADRRNLSALASISDILKSSYYLHAADNTDKNRKPDIVKFHYYMAKVLFPGYRLYKENTSGETVSSDIESAYVLSVISEDEKGNLFYDLALQDVESIAKIRETSEFLPRLRVSNSAQTGDVSLKSRLEYLQAFVNHIDEKNKNYDAEMNPNDGESHISYSISNLAAVHSISPSNLLKADSLGGMPLPSIAITRLDKPYTFDGDDNIYLVGGANMVDPANGADVHNRDMWAGVFPALLWKGKNYSDREQFIKLSEDVSEKYFDEDSESSLFYLREALSENKKRDVEYWLSSSRVVRAMFAGEKGYDPKGKKRTKKNGEIVNDSSENEDVFKGYTEKHKKHFAAWVGEKLEDWFEEKALIKETGDEANLENITRYMLKKKSVGSEKSFTFSSGKMRSTRSRKLKSLDEIKKDRDLIATSQESKDSKSKADELIGAFQDRMYSYVEHFDVLDDAVKILAEVKGKPSIEKILKGIKKYYGVTPFYESMATDEELLNLGVKSIELLENEVEDYYEAVPQRSVALEEFSYAVLPEALKKNKEINGVFQKNGIKRVYHDGSFDGRKQAMSGLIDSAVSFSLGRSGGGKSSPLDDGTVWAALSNSMETGARKKVEILSKYQENLKAHLAAYGMNEDGSLKSSEWRRETRLKSAGEYLTSGVRRWFDAQGLDMPKGLVKLMKEVDSGNVDGGVKKLVRTLKGSYAIGQLLDERLSKAGFDADGGVKSLLRGLSEVFTHDAAMKLLGVMDSAVGALPMNVRERLWPENMVLLRDNVLKAKTPKGQQGALRRLAYQVNYAIEGALKISQLDEVNRLLKWSEEREGENRVKRGKLMVDVQREVRRIRAVLALGEKQLEDERSAVEKTINEMSEDDRGYDDRLSYMLLLDTYGGLRHRTEKGALMTDSGKMERALVDLRSLYGRGRRLNKFMVAHRRELREKLVNDAVTSLGREGSLHTSERSKQKRFHGKIVGAARQFLSFENVMDDVFGEAEFSKNIIEKSYLVKSFLIVLLIMIEYRHVYYYEHGKSS